VRAEHRGRFGHEMHTAEDDDRLVGSGCLPRQRQRIAREIRQVLDLGNLVIVSQDDRFARSAQLADLGDKVDGIGVHSSISKLMSSALTECVIAPDEMKSTPLAATSARFSRVMPPEASSFARPAAIVAAWPISAGDMLSSRMTSAPASSA